MEDLPLGRIAALVPEFAVKDLPLGRTLMIYIYIKIKSVALQFRRAKTDWSGYCQMANYSRGDLVVSEAPSLNLSFNFLIQILLLLISRSYPIVLTRLGGPRFRSYSSRKVCRPRWSRGYHTRHWIRDPPWSPNIIWPSLSSIIISLRAPLTWDVDMP